jgi:hypothetical protein
MPTGHFWAGGLYLCSSKQNGNLYAGFRVFLTWLLELDCISARIGCAWQWRRTRFCQPLDDPSQ